MRLFNRSKPDIEGAYQRYADILYRVALARLANDADAQDAVQDVFIKYMSVSPEFKSCEHERAWFLRTAVNRCHDISRRQKTRNTLPLEDALGVAAQTTDGVTELMGLLESIPDKLKDTVILHCLEGFALEQTAEILNVSLSAAKMRLSRARDALRILREEKDDV